MKNNDFYFPIEKVNNEVYFNIKANEDFAYSIIGDINGESTILNSCSSTYNLLKNINVFPIVENALIDKNLSISKKYINIDNSRFYAYYIINNYYTYIDSNNNRIDKVKPVVIVRNSYNRLVRFSISIALYRETTDTILFLNLPKNVLSIDKKHSQDVIFTTKKVLSFLEFFINNLKNYTKEYIKLNNNILNINNIDNDLLNIMFSLKIPEYRLKEIKRFVLNEYESFNKITYLSLFTAIVNHYDKDYIKALEAKENIFKDVCKVFNIE